VYTPEPGPTEEEGIAMAPDGRSFITAVAPRFLRGLNTEACADKRERLSAWLFGWWGSE